jgi:hypothetical protein
VEQLGRGLELLVLEQTANEGVARIFFRVVGLRRVGTRQQHAALDMNESGRHDQELARHLEIELLHQVEILEILAGYEGDGNVVDADLVLLDQMHEQIEGPFEGRQLDPDVFEL